MLDITREIEQLIQAYEATDMEIPQFSEEFFVATRMLIRQGIPMREQRLSVRVPHQKQLHFDFDEPAADQD